MLRKLYRKINIRGKILRLSVDADLWSRYYAPSRNYIRVTPSKKLRREAVSANHRGWVEKRNYYHTRIVTAVENSGQKVVSRNRQG